MGRHHAEVVWVGRDDENEDDKRKMKELHQQKSGANEQECGGKRWTRKKRMPGCWTAVQQRGRNEQSIGNVTTACRTWRISLGKMKS